MIIIFKLVVVGRNSYRNAKCSSFICWGSTFHFIAFALFSIGFMQNFYKLLKKVFDIREKSRATGSSGGLLISMGI
jgi:hypothetical protein